MTDSPLKLCVLGNSHLAAVRSAWVDNPENWPGIAPQFVGAHKGLLLETKVINGWLRPSTPAAKDAFARLGGGSGVLLRDFDAFVVTGCLVALSLSISVYRRLHWVGLASVGRSQDLASDPKLLVSQRAALETMRAKFSERLGPRLVAHLRRHTTAPIFLTSQPRVSAALLESFDPTTQAHRVAHLAGDGRGVSDLSEHAAQRAVKAAGGRYIPQPDNTIVDHIMTNPDYMTGAVRLTAKGNQPQPAKDLRHANARYGARVLDQICEALSGEDATLPQPVTL